MRLVRGSPGSGKTALIFREFKAALAGNRAETRIVVPTATLVRHFQHELARDGIVLAPRSVVSMNRFVRECAGDATVVPDSLLRLLVRDALQRLNPPEFADVAGTAGMADVAVETIRLLENAGCDPRRLAAVRGLNAPAKAFARVWANVESALVARGYLSRPQLFAMAATHPGGMKLWLDGFVTLSPLESGFLQAVASRSDVTITSLDDPHDEIRRWALESGARDQLLSGPGRLPARVAVFAQDIEREADEIARRIVELRAAGTEYHDIGVALRDAAAYRPLLETTFERFGVPARFYFSRPLASHAAAVFLSGIIRCALEGWNFETALAALHVHPGWSATSAFDRFDFTVREAMPGRGSAALLALASDEWLAGKLRDCFAIDAWLGQQRTPASWGEQIAAWAAALYRPGRLDSPANERDLSLLRSHSEGLRAWLDAIDTAIAFWPSDSNKVALAEFWAVASHAIEGAGVGALDERRDAVHVMNALEARQWNLSVLFLCGMTDRDYPRKHPGHLLLTQGDIEKLRREGVRVRSAEDQDKDEFALFRSLETRASAHFILTCPLHDAAGRGVAASEFMESAQAVSAAPCAPLAAGPSQSPPRFGRIRASDLLAAIAARHATVSTTQIESLMQCRFQFFTRRTLDLGARPERPHERLNPREAGLILHATLELWLKDRTQNFADLFEHAFEEACREHHLPRGFRLEVERFTLGAIARAVSSRELWRAERSDAEVEVVLPLIDGVTMTGRVDRIDHVGNGDCVVIDYKSKGVAGMKRLIESETALQGPLYSLALRRNLGLNPVAMVYWAVREDKRYGWGAIPCYNEPLEPIPADWETAAADRIAGRLGDFFAGNVSPEPAHEDACRYCDARDACRVEETQTLVMIEGANA